MMRTRSHLLYALFLPFLLSGVFVLGGCKQMDRLVINGETAQLMENRINEQLWDPEHMLMGNTSSNMRNGGYVLSDKQDILFITDMVFADGSTVHYLQELPISQIGSLTARNEMIAEIDGILLGTYHHHVLYIDAESNTIFAFDTQEYLKSMVFEKPVGKAFLMDGHIYASAAESGDLWKIELTLDLSNGIGASPTLIYASAGELMDISKGIAYIAKTNAYSTLDKIDLDSAQMQGSLVGGYYRDVQISGSWLFYLQDNRLMRQPLTGGEPVSASVREVDEYAVWGPYLAFSETDCGLVISHLDGSGIIQISADKASSIQLLDNRLYYRNGYDDNAIYVIDLTEGVRSALLGPTLTDGGIHFITMDQQESNGFSDMYAARIRGIAEEKSSNERYWGELSPPLLFAEVGPDGEPVKFHRLKDAEFSPDEVAALVIISYEDTVLGRYTDGGLAYRRDTVLTLFHPDYPDPYLSWVVQGRPPSEIKSGEGDRYGIPVSWHQKALDLIELIESRI